jgi:drug/metabolite transporter (DMT)-like permease
VSKLNLGLLGESAAVVTSCLWTLSSIFFSAGRRIGSLNVNAYRTVMATGFLIVAHVVLLRTILPLASNAQWFWMGASCVVGLGFGDSALFAAYVTIGPRRSLLVYASAPIFAALCAYLMLGEMMPTLAIVGIAVTLAGIVVVVLEREENSGEGGEFWRNSTLHEAEKLRCFLCVDRRSWSRSRVSSQPVQPQGSSVRSGSARQKPQ